MRCECSDNTEKSPTPPAALATAPVLVFLDQCEDRTQQAPPPMSAAKKAKRTPLAPNAMSAADEEVAIEAAMGDASA